MSIHLTNGSTDVVARWMAAYSEWENGQSASPSATDLVLYAIEVLDVNPCVFAVDDLDAFTDEVYEMLCDSDDLVPIAEFVVETITQRVAL
jgi:transcriptional regulator with XRE-family HTH domain